MHKGIGGMGLKNTRLLNISLLGRHVWRLINHKETLCYKVLSSKYFLEGDPFNSKVVDKASFAWTRLHAAAEALKEGFGWQVGDGRTIHLKDHC